MSENLRKYKQLTIISDTALRKNGDSSFGLAPVVRELEKVALGFDKVVWVGFEIPELALEKINSSKIETITLKRCGGDKLIDKLKVFLQTPEMILVIAKTIFKADVVHTRLPSAPAFIAVLMSFLLRKKIWWNKYAGNWNQQKPPFFYEIQRKLLKTAKHTNVTINGFWSDQPAHCYSFENPCLTRDDLEKGSKIAEAKTFKAPFRLVFVGRLDEHKGVDTIIESLKTIDLNLIERIEFIGDGEKRKEYEKTCEFTGAKVVFRGFLGNAEVHRALSEAHFFLLPSKSEGFPKVIAEAACYGCVPVVSDVGSIGHYINDESNGFIWKIDGGETFSEVLRNAVNSNEKTLKEKSANVLRVAELFSFENYLAKLEKYILDKN